MNTVSQLIGGSIATAIAGSIFANKLAKVLPIYAPGAPVQILKNSVEALKTLPEAQKAGAIHAYCLALADTYLLAVGTGAASILAGLLVRNLSVKGKDMTAVAA